ncbi:hypothetical protein D3C72_1365910 [compost metagenome]
MGSALGVDVQRAAANELKGRIELLGEIIRTAAVEGKRRNGGKRMLVAHEAAKTGFHAPDGEQRTSRHAVSAFDGRKQSCIVLLHGLAA